MSRRHAVVTRYFDERRSTPADDDGSIMILEPSDPSIIHHNPTTFHR
jgi:hypothetical protein